jgi:hypothetical protein
VRAKQRYAVVAVGWVHAHACGKRECSVASFKRVYAKVAVNGRHGERRIRKQHVVVAVREANLAADVGVLARHHQHTFHFAVQNKN